MREGHHPSILGIASEFGQRNIFRGVGVRHGAVSKNNSNAQKKNKGGEKRNLVYGPKRRITKKKNIPGENR